MPSETTQQKLQIIVEGIGKLVKLTTANKDLERGQKSLAKGIIALNRQFNSKGPIAKLQKQTELTKNAVLGLNVQVKRLAASLNTVRNSAIRATKSFRSFGIIRGVVFGSLISRGVAALTNAFITSISSAAEFILKIGEIRTISQEAQQTTGQWSEQLRRLSDQFGIDVLDVAEGAYRAVSNQIAKGAETTEFLTEALRLSVITLATTEESVLALTGVLNSYGLSAAHARNVSDALFKTIELGNLRLGDIARTIGNVTILASKLGVTYKEVFASLDVLTIQGIDAATGMTFLRNVFLKLIKPTKPMLELFNKLGVSSGKAAIAQFGFTGALEQFQIAAKESGDELAGFGQLFGRLRAIIGGVALDFKRTALTLDKIKEAASSADAAFKLMTGNLGKQFFIGLNEIVNFFKVDIGAVFVKSIVKGTSAFGGMLATLKLILLAIVAIGVSIALTFSVGLVASFTTALIATNLTLLQMGAIIGGINRAFILMRVAIVGLIFVAAFELTKFLLDGAKSVDIFAEKWTSKFSKESNKRIVIYDKEMKELLSLTSGRVAQVIEVFTVLGNRIQERFTKLSLIGKTQKEINAQVLKDQVSVLKGLGKITQAEALLRKEIKKVTEEFVARSEERLKIKESDVTEDSLKELKSLDSRIRELQNTVLSLESKKRIKLTERIRGIGGPSRFDREIIGKSQKQQEKEFNRANLIRSRIQQLAAGRPGDQTSLLQVKAQVENLRQVKTIEIVLKTVSGIQDDIAEKVSDENKLRKGSFKIFSETKGSLEGINESLSSTLINFRLLNEFGSGTTDFSDLGGIAVEALDEARKALEKEFNLENLQNAIVKLDAFKVALATVGEDDLISGISRILISDNLDSQLEQLQSDLAKAKSQLLLADEFEVVIKKLEGPLKRIKDAKDSIVQAQESFDLARRLSGDSVELLAEQNAIILGAAIKATNDLKSIYDEAIRELRSNAEQIKQLRAEILKGFPVKGEQFGGPITRAHGGSIGKDSQSVLLDPGEFVMNARQTSKFLPQLIAMNSGSRRFESGGTVTNVGDVNVNISTPEGQKLNARDIGNQIRRELSRGLLRN